MYDIPDITIEHPGPGAAVVVFEGEHDLSHREELRELLASLVSAHELVVADLSEARFVDASVVDALVRARKTATELGKEFRLQVGTAAIVRRVFEITDVLELLDWAPTREAALRGRGVPPASEDRPGSLP